MLCPHGDGATIVSPQHGGGCALCRISQARFDVITSRPNPDGSVPMPYPEVPPMEAARFPRAFGTTGAVFRGSIPGGFSTPKGGGYDDLAGHNANATRRAAERDVAHRARVLAAELLRQRLGAM